MKWGVVETDTSMQYRVTPHELDWTVSVVGECTPLLLRAGARDIDDHLYYYELFSKFAINFILVACCTQQVNAWELAIACQVCNSYYIIFMFIVLADLKCGNTITL